MLNNSVTNSLRPVMLLAPMTHAWTHQCHRQGLQYELWLILKKWSTRSFENIMQNWMANRNMQFRWNFAHSSKRTVSIDTLLVFWAVILSLVCFMNLLYEFQYLKLNQHAPTAVHCYGTLYSLKHSSALFSLHLESYEHFLLGQESSFKFGLHSK